jgi:aminopeptidase N
MYLAIALSVLGQIGGAADGGPPMNSQHDDLGICKSGLLRHISRYETRRSMPLARAGDADTDVLHYALDIEIIPSSEWLGGSNTITVRSLIADLDTFEIRLRDTFNISMVQVNGVPVNWQRLSETTIEVELDHTYTIGEEFDLVIAYDGYPVGLGFGSIEFMSQDGYPLVFTLSEPWYAHTWWPTKEDNTDKATGELKITVPNTLTIAANGLLMAVDDVGGGRDRYHWVTGYQTATYLFCFSAAHYNTFGDFFDYGDGLMPVDFFIFPSSDNSNNRDKWLLSADMLGTFSDIFGLYPFVNEKYGIYEFGFGGGMEHQTMTGQGGFGESLTSHELSHQWWGDMITCGTWQDIWLNEGFAEYSEALWYEHKPGGGEDDLHAAMADRRPWDVNGSVYVPAEELDDLYRIFSSNFSYRKGAWVLHQLRHVVGDDVFFDILAAYREAFEYGSAITEDLRMVAEDVYGGDLTWFFDEWVYDIGAPAYRYAWRQHEFAGRTFIELYIEQVQDASYPIFIMPLDVALTGPGGDSIEVVWNDAEAEHLMFESNGAVDTLELDPKDWTLHTSNSTTGFVEGPPKIVLTSPEPGSEIASGPDTAVGITFHKNVIAEAGDFSLVGDIAGAIPFDFEYDWQSQTATLTPTDLLPVDTYTLTIDDNVIDVVAALSLDGEVVDAEDPQSLPSGEGLPGGDAVIRFSVTSVQSPADFDGDGDVDTADLLHLLACWGTPCGDVDGDGDTDAADLLALLAAWGPYR